MGLFAAIPLVWAFVLVLALVRLVVGPGPGPAQAHTLHPRHPIWLAPGVDPDVLARDLTAFVHEAAKAPHAYRPSPERGKVLRSPARRFLVLPVLYADGPATPPVSTEDLQRQWFGSGSASSVRGYWDVASRGRFLAEGEVLPWQRLPRNAQQYYNFINNQFVGANSRRLAEDASRAASRFVDGRGFDDDGPDGIAGSGDDDGVIDFLVVLHPDPGVEVTNDSDGVVAVQGRLDQAQRDALLAEFGIGVDAFVVASAYGPLGVWAHESGHLLGLSDLYDVRIAADDTGTAAGGLGIWSLMASGTWGGEGFLPSDLDAYSRSILGWGTGQTIEQDGVYQAIDDPSGDRNWLELRPAFDWGRERFLVELRAPVAGGVVDGALPSPGVLMYRVNEDARGCGQDSLILHLEQADGRFDLEQLANDGDAGDVYTEFVGSNELGPNTVPDSRSRTPTVQKRPPILRVADVDLGTTPRAQIDLQMTQATALRLQTAEFETPSSGTRRTHLIPGETLPWELVFSELGPAAADASIRVLSTDPELIATPTTSLPLVRSGSTWVLEETLVIAASGATPPYTSPGIRLGIQVNGRPEEVLDLGIPVATSVGLPPSAFGAWTPSVPSPGFPASSFRALTPLDAPAFGAQGWTTVIDTGANGYGNCCELILESPWLDVPPDSHLSFWSRHHTEAADPGEAWDGGAVEWQRPGGPWKPISIVEGRSVLLKPLSRGATAGAIGLGGDAVPWGLYRAAWTDLAVPFRVRFRFGSDDTVIVQKGDGGWGLAAAGTDPAPAVADVQVRGVGGGQYEATVDLMGDLSTVQQVGLWGRVPPSTSWDQLSPAQPRGPNQTQFHFAFSAPAGAPTLDVGAFETTGFRRLGSAGIRVGNAGAPSALAVAPNPGRPLVLSTTPAPRERVVVVWNLQGRRVRELRLAPDVGAVEWDGNDAAGQRLAAGKYVAALQDDTSTSVSLTLLP